MQPPEGWAAYLIETLGIEWYRIPVVVISAVIIYLVFMFLVRLFGARVLTVTSGFDVLVFMTIGAVAGRAILGHPPTVAAGVIALCTLMVLEAIFGAIERTWKSKRLVSLSPVLVFAHGLPLEAACRKTHTSQTDLHAAMRKAGIAHPDEAQCIILEPYGSYSVIRAGQPLDPQLFAHVDGAKEYLFAYRT